MNGLELLRAFLVGGAICALVQILMERTKLLPGLFLHLQNWYSSI